MKAFAENPRAVQTILGGRRISIFGIESPEGISLLGILYYFTQTSHTENIPYALINQLELNVESHSRTLLCTQTTHPKSGQIVQESFQERFDQQDF